MPIVDEAAAIAELKVISKNARLYLMDRIGNNLNVIHFCNDLGKKESVTQAANRLLVDMKKIGLFEMHRTRAIREEVKNNGRDSSNIQIEQSGVGGAGDAGTGQ